MNQPQYNATSYIFRCFGECIYVYCCFGKEKMYHNVTTLSSVWQLMGNPFSPLKSPLLSFCCLFRLGRILEVEFFNMTRHVMTACQRYATITQRFWTTHKYFGVGRSSISSYEFIQVRPSPEFHMPEQF